MTDTTDLIARLRDCAALSPRDKDRHEAADALEAQAQALEAYRVKTDSLRWEHGELESRLAAAERDAERLKERLEEATDLLGFAEIRLLAFGQHRSANPDYVLAMDAIKLFLLTADSAKEGK